MATFNILKTEITCSNCEQIRPVNIQFQFGDTWQSVYKVGEKLIWGGNDSYLRQQKANEIKF